MTQLSRIFLYILIVIAHSLLGTDPDKRSDEQLSDQQIWLLQAAGALCANTAGGLLLVGSADGCLSLEHSKLGSSDHPSSDLALHDMWAGQPLAFVPTKNTLLLSVTWLALAFVPTKNTLLLSVT